MRCINGQREQHRKEFELFSKMVYSRRYDVARKKKNVANKLFGNIRIKLFANMNYNHHLLITINSDQFA